jgi:AcrR family transcriptional regulator
MADAKLDTQIRREQIAEAALRLVATVGLRQLSMAAIAKQVGIVPSGIYRHFKNKEAILAAVLDRIERRLLANVQAAREESDDPVECLKGVFFRHIGFIRDGRAIPRLIFSDDVHAENPRYRLRIFEILLHYRSAVGEIIRRGQSQGRIRKDIDIPTIAMMLFGTVIPAGILWHWTDGKFNVMQYARQAWRTFETAIVVVKKKVPKRS